ncbi:MULTISPECIES: TetR/AcrR family transcriptional regulator [Amycolatopsis]|uniref:TetR/AcrR family transcriptional regulator n=1 Tax=Amycolatopsis thermalba TaxID=944492 RepID=A0ABY4P0Q3_9PSEU|nr:MULTISPECIES: TetR/AcrR family transcriptional regulator [Amycolatopsis]OXM63585.1 TetR family transcriptional regulator [Amycolatopsis sp. KNN50.9b]UQS25863.1 TetR/AcrR family transcriptional regulator [Amycolatopsis thermalba]
MGRRRTGSYAAGRERRARIVAAAAERFAERGYHRVPLARIAADVGLTEGGLLYHFPTKKHLLHAVAEHRIATTARWWTELDADATLADVLAEMVASTERHLAQPGLIELFVLCSAEAADASSPAHAVFAARYAETVDAIAALFTRCAERGELAPGTDCRELARECVAVSDGLQLQWVLADGDLDLVGGVRAHLARIAGAVSTTSV